MGYITTAEAVGLTDWNVADLLRVARIAYQNVQQVVELEIRFGTADEGIDVFR